MCDPEPDYLETSGQRAYCYNCKTNNPFFVVEVLDTVLALEFFRKVLLPNNFSHALLAIVFIVEKKIRGHHFGHQINQEKITLFLE